MTTIPGSLLLCASSPYAKRGALWDAYRRYFGTDDRDVLVWKAATREMNPSVPKAVVNRQRDPASAAAEYNAEFRSDIDSFIPREVVDAVISPGVFERAPLQSVRYVAFVDPSGGSVDAMTMAIAHREGKVAVLDAVREVKPPFSPERVVAEFADVLKRYRVMKVYGDRYAGEWPVAAFRSHGITYEASAKPKSDLYQELLHARTETLSLREKVRPQAEAMLKTTSEGYRAGRFSLLELADAQIQLIELEREAIRAAAQFHTLMIDIKRVTGEPITALSTRSTP